MRQITRRALAGLLVVVGALLALGAVPSALGSGPPYYLVVTETESAGPAANVTDISERRYPYLTGALESSDDRSSPYRRGRFGLKESFSHSPFDEVDALATRSPEARLDDGAVRISYRGRYYRAEVVQG